MAKEKLLQAMRERLAAMVDAETANNVLDVLTYELRGYNVEEITTEVVPYEGDNEKILKSFLACLVVEGKSKGTIKVYGYSIRNLFAFLGNKRYDSITTYDIRAWLASIKMSGCKGTSVRNQRCFIMPFFSWLYNEGLIEKNPCVSIKPIKVPQEEKEAFSSEDIDTIRSNCKKPVERAVVEILLASGLRVAELCNLRVEDVNFDELTVRVKGGKGGKDRTTFITPVAKKYIILYMQSNPKKSAFVFTTKRGGAYSTAGITKITKQLTKVCGIHIHPHRFRRTLATDLARKGMPIQEIQKLLGHTSIETTRTYIETQTDKVESSYRQFVA